MSKSSTPYSIFYFPFNLYLENGKDVLRVHRENNHDNKTKLEQNQT